MELLEEERKATKRKQEELASTGYRCGICNMETMNIETICFLDVHLISFNLIVYRLVRTVIAKNVSTKTSC